MDRSVRVLCRILTCLSAGGQVEEMREGVYSTGEKRDHLGRTRADFKNELAAAGLDADAVRRLNAAGKQLNDAAGDYGVEPFYGVSCQFDQAAHDKLVDKGLITEAGNISAAGKDYLSDIHAKVRSVVDASPDAKRDAVTEAGFYLPGQPITDAIQWAESTCSVIERLEAHDG